MPSTYSPLLRLELLGAGEQSGLWGDTTNKNIGQLIEQAIAGVTTVSLSGGAGDYTLSALDGTYDESRSAVLKFIGNPSGTKNIIIPTETKLYVVRNDCGQTITVKTSAQITGVTLLDGEASLVFCDGTNAVAGIATAGVGPTTVSNGGTGATSFTGGFIKSPGGTGTLTSSATVNAATELSNAVPVGNGGTGVTGFTAGSLVIGNGSSPLTTLVGGTSGQVATWNGSAWTAATPSAGVASVFGRTGTVSAQASDYSSFYPSLTGTGATGTWTIGITGSAANLGGVPASSYARKDAANVFTARCDFPAGGCVSPEFSFTNATSISHNGDFAMQFNVSLQTRMFIYSSGDLQITGSNATKASGTTWINPSDRRLKDDVVGYTKGLSELVQIQPKSFTFNGKAGSTAGLKAVGIIADEIEQVLPSTVNTRMAKLNPEDVAETAIKYFDASELTWVMVNAIKELKAEVDSLKAQLAAK